MAAAGLYRAWDSFLGTVSGRRLSAQIKLKIPLFNVLFADAQLEQFFSVLGLMLRNGTSILHALQILEEIFSHDPIYVEAICAMREDLSRGKALPEALERSKIVPDLAIDSISSGEEAGKLTESLDNLADYYRERVEVFSAQLAVMVEPVTVVVLGGVVGLIIFSLFMPMIELSNLKV
jgi:type IV pilus assembly protein PilC